nr:transglutaminase-like cysteine peptidase [Rhizobium sullae]
MLDNLADEIKPCHAAPYKFLKRQGHQNPIDG